VLLDMGNSKETYREAGNWFAENDSWLQLPAMFTWIPVRTQVTNELPHSNLSTCRTSNKDALHFNT